MAHDAICCGQPLDASLGKYGCPNCHGERAASRARPRREPFDWRSNPPPGMTPQGIRFNDELQSIAGIALVLLPQGFNTRAEIAAAEAWVRASRDVASCKILRTGSSAIAAWDWASWYAKHPAASADLERLFDAMRPDLGADEAGA